jgi:hypothetical protein
MTSPHNSCGALPTTLGTKKFLHQTVVKQDLRCVGFNSLRAIEYGIIWPSDMPKLKGGA